MVNEVLDVTGGLAVNSFVSEQQHLVIDSEVDRKPVQSGEYGCDVA